MSIYITIEGLTSVIVLSQLEPRFMTNIHGLPVVFELRSGSAYMQILESPGVQTGSMLMPDLRMYPLTSSGITVTACTRKAPASLSL